MDQRDSDAASPEVERPGEVAKEDGIVTSEMIQEEEKLHKRTLLEERRLQLAEFDKKQKELCYKRLQTLLHQSNLYKDFILSKIEKDKQTTRERLEKRQLKENEEKKESTRGKSPRAAKRKAADSQDTSPQKKKVNSKVSKKKREENVLKDINKEELLNYQENKNTLDNKPSADSDARSLDGVPISARQPVLFTGGVMRTYQLEGFEWLNVLYLNAINGILADEMGLGKTIQCIALVAHLIAENLPGPYLICAPLSTVSNWIAEFKRFTPLIPVVLFHGAYQDRVNLLKKIGRKQRVGEFESHPVVITSYEIAMRDKKHLSSFFWGYIIVDEGHRIKNYNCRLVRDLKTYRAHNRLLLTGTPIQNSLAELWSLLNFLLPEIFNDLQLFESWFDVKEMTKDGTDKEIIEQEQQKQIICTMQQILSPFLLRRTKDDVQLDLPPKKEVLVYAPLSPLQEEYYSALVTHTVSRINGTNQVKEEDEDLDEKGRRRRSCKKSVSYKEISENNIWAVDDSSNQSDESVEKLAQSLSSGKLAESYSSFSLNNIMMHLRKTCNHPYLIHYQIDSDTNSYYVDEDLINKSGKLQLLDCLMKELYKRKHKVLLFSQMTAMLDILEDYCELRGYQYCRLDGSIKLTDRMEGIKEFNEDSDIFVFLLSTRAGGLGINLVGADTVIIFDSDWNPQVDLQAQDRCHRIGQTKPVVVYRLVTKNTIDQKIVERGVAKRKLEKMIIQKGKFTTAFSEQTKTRLTAEELLELLHSTDHSDVVHSTAPVLTKEQLNHLLDRSDMVADRNKGKTSHVKLEGVFNTLESNVSL